MKIIKINNKKFYISFFINNKNQLSPQNFTILYSLPLQQQISISILQGLMMDQSVHGSLQSLFDKSIENYQNDEFQIALELINKCIEISPQSSDLLTNRASIQSKLLKYDNAVDDLQNVLIYSPYNYIPYFNLSSVYYKKGKKIQALQNICCSLSCLYVTKSKFTQDLIDIAMGLFYAHNNVEAQVLKAMIYLKRGNEKTALKSLDRALQIDGSNKILKQIYQSVYKQLFPYHDLQQSTDDQQKNTEYFSNLRLKCSYQPSQSDNIDDLIDQKMQEFNKLLIQVRQLQASQQSQPRQIRVVNELWDQGQDKTFEIRKSHRF